MNDARVFGPGCQPVAFRRDAELSRCRTLAAQLVDALDKAATAAATSGRCSANLRTLRGDASDLYWGVVLEDGKLQES